MPDDSRKNHDKGKNTAKDQRKPRQSRNLRKAEEIPVKTEDIKSSAPKVIVPQKPVYKDPGPEFYKNLKRETDEIVKITEEENFKYKKKEIQSNWAKYEMPIDSYDDIDEQDDGADYEKLIQAPLSVGGHFQFKHEKSWEESTGPSIYDKYFDIKMDNLSIAISTIPFYERNKIDTTLFSETDMLNMNNRATRYKRKYYNDKKYACPEDDAIERQLNILKEGIDKGKVNEEDSDSENESQLDVNFDIKLGCDDMKIDSHPNSVINNTHKPQQKDDIKKTNEQTTSDIDDIIFQKVPELKILHKEPDVPPVSKVLKEKESITFDEFLEEPVKKVEHSPGVITKTELNEMNEKPAAQEVAATSNLNVNPVIESPEDLEKWLDDFLDG